MDDKLFEIFSENTEIPAVVRKHANAALAQIEGRKHPDSPNLRPYGAGRKKSPRRILRTVLIAASLVALLCTGVLAAGHYLGISDFFARSGRTLSEDASSLVQSVTSQTATENPLVDFEVKEALYDSETVYVVLSARAADPDKYLLVPSDTTAPEDPAQTIGLDSPLTIGEYAEANEKEILYIGCGFDYTQHPSMDSYSFRSTLMPDGSMSIMIQGNGWDSSAQTLTCQNTVAPPGAKNVDDILRSEITFPVENLDDTASYSYIPADSADLPEGFTLYGVTLKETALGLYAEISYAPAENQSVPLFSFLDESLTAWDGFLGSTGSRTQEDGSLLAQFSYAKRAVPDTLILQISHPETGEVLKNISFVRNN